MNDILTIVKDAIWNIFNRPTFADLADIIIVAFLLYQLLMLTKQTRASAVLKGLAMLIVASWVSNLLKLSALNWLILKVVDNGAVVLVILFQPELRKALEQIGSGTMLDNSHADDVIDNNRIIEELTHCLLSLSRRRVGALIVFEQKTGIQDIIDTGTKVDAMISGALIENIFEPNTPLHDGAVVIRGPRLMAAGCILTLSEGNGISKELGTRHRAALGVSETTDAIVLIVSEETGIISMAKAGKLTRHLDSAGVSQVLRGMYRHQAGGIINALKNSTKKIRGKKGDDSNEKR